jgi:hypothetical protein
MPGAVDAETSDESRSQGSRRLPGPELNRHRTGWAPPTTKLHSSMLIRQPLHGVVGRFAQAVVGLRLDLEVLRLTDRVVAP